MLPCRLHPRLLCAAASFALLALRLPSSAQTPNEEATVIDVAGTRIDDKELAAQLAYESESVLEVARRDENAARTLAVNWYQAELIAKAAADDGLIAETPGLQGAARNLGRRLIVRKYVDRLMAKEQAPDKAELESYYAMHKEACSAPMRVRIAQVGVVIPRHASAVESEAANKRLDAMRARIAAGESFATVADEDSDIPGRKPGGEMGWFTVKELGQQAGAGTIASTPAGALTEPIRTEIGLQVYKVLEKEESRTKTLEECRGELATIIDGEYRKSAVRRRIDDLARRYNASMNIDAFVAVARKVHGVETQPGQPVAPGAAGMDQGTSVTEAAVPR